MAARILFVDDEAPIRELLSLYFRKKGYEVTTAVTGQEAKETLQREHFGLVILDLNLAGESGLEWLAYFKKEFPKLPVIVLTGMEDETLVGKAWKAGANAFMRKTDSLDELFAVVQAQLRV